MLIVAIVIIVSIVVVVLIVFFTTKGGIVGLGCRLGRDFPFETLEVGNWKHLAPFKTDFAFVAGTRLSPFVSTGGSTTVSRTFSPTYSLALLGRTSRRFQCVQFHNVRVVSFRVPQLSPGGSLCEPYPGFVESLRAPREHSVS